MKRVVWLTDVHLNFLPGARIAAFLAEIAARRPDALLISGDIGESHNVCDYLEDFRRAIDAPIYFVLGNHDFYYGSIRRTREAVVHLCAEQPRLHYLSVDEPQPLAPQVGVIGCDGWADGMLGDYQRSLVMMHDWKLIAELAGHDKRSRWEVLKGLAAENAAHLEKVLPAALAQFRDVVLVTHVPPFREACWHEGNISDDQWLPHFTCHATGQVILEVMQAHPDNRLTVLCGHTHGHGETQPLQNVQVITGGAQYGAPAIGRVFEFD